MNKKLIVVAGFSLAMLPIAGEFVAASSQGFTDELNVVINEACTLEYGDSFDDIERSFSATVPAGTVKELTQDGSDAGTGITVTCNTQNSTWHVTASAVDLTNGISSFTRGTETSGSTSMWAFKLGTGTYADWSALPANDSTVLSSSMSGVSNTFNPQYRVYVAPAQASGTNYTGSVVYTVVLGA